MCARLLVIRLVDQTRWTFITRNDPISLSIFRTMRKLFVSVIVTLAVWCRLLDASPITIPLTPEGEIDNVIPSYFSSKKMPRPYHKVTPNQSYAVLELELDLHDSCSLDFRHQWTVHTGSAIYSTPVIFPKGDHSDMKNIFVASYFNYIEVIQGDGYRPAGWPIAFEDSSFQSSPLVFDIDNDGNADIGVVDRDANLFWIRTGEFGSYLEDYHIQVPKLRILRNWYDAVKDSFTGSYVMISMFDRYQVPSYMRGNTPSPSRSPALRKNSTVKHAKLDPLSSLNVKGLQKPKWSIDTNEASEPVFPPSGNGERRRLLAEGEEQEGAEQGEGDHESEGEGEGIDNFYVDHGEHDLYADGDAGEEDPAHGNAPFDTDMSDLPLEEGLEGENGGHGNHGHDFVNGDHADNSPFYTYGAAESTYGATGRHVRNGADDGVGYYMTRRQFEENEDEADSKFVNVDPHVLATPAMGDINGDGHMEIVFPVSYYFDAQDYLTTPLPDGIDGDMYVASGLVCWDMQAQEWTWTVHLDLTTTKSKFQGLMYASPTIADLDGDKRMEVIVGTSMGMLYVVDGESGFVRHNFPLQFGSIQAQVAVADITGGFEMEMIVGDMGGNLVVLNVHGEVLWDRHLSGALPYTATIGDVDGDGQMDVVVVAVVESTVTRPKAKRTRKNSNEEAEEGVGDGPETETIRRVRSHVWALRGDTGATIPGFPIALPQEETISGPVLLLHDYATLTRYVEAQALQQEESLVTALTRHILNIRFPFASNSTSGAAASSSTTTKGSASKDAADKDKAKVVKDRTNKNDEEDAAASMGSPGDSARAAHIVAESFEHLQHIKDEAITTASLLGAVEDNDGVYLLIPGFQGHLYIVALAYDTVLKKQDFCMQKLDVGSPIAATPLLEDVTGDGYLDLVVATLPGEVMVYETNMPRHAGNIWDSFPRHHRRSFSTGDLIISIPEAERQRLQRLESRGDPLIRVNFDLVDLRCSKLGSHGVWHRDINSRDCAGERKYTVTITRGKSNSVRAPLWTGTFQQPGHYQAVIPLQGPDVLTLLIAVTTEHGLYSEDSVSIAISTRFYVWLKYFVLLPVVVFCALSLGRLPTMLTSLWTSAHRAQLATAASRQR